MIPLRSTWNGVAAVAAAAFLALVPLGAGAQTKGGTLIMVVQPEPPSMASYISTSQPIGQVATKVYDGLLEYDSDTNALPSLAESWEVGDGGTSITFKLREGVKWHDGEPFTSADVQFTFMDVLKKFHPRGINNYRALEAVETPDEHTAVFRLSGPAPYILRILSGYESPVVPKHVFADQDVRNYSHANKPIGTGPFKFVEWKRGQYIRFDRNEDYWKPGLPHLDRIVARFIPDAGTRTAAMETGEVHLTAYSHIPAQDLASLAKLPHLTVTEKGYEMMPGVTFLIFDTTRAPFDDRRVRQAVSYAIDRQFIIDAVWHGYGKPATGPMSSKLIWYTDQVRRYDVPNRAGQQAARRGRLSAQGRRVPVRDDPRRAAIRRSVAAVRRDHGPGARPDRHQGDDPLRGHPNVVEAGLHRLRLPTHLHGLLQLLRSGHRGAPRLSLEPDQAGNGVRQCGPVVLRGDRRVDGRGGRGARFRQAQEAL